MYKSIFSDGKEKVLECFYNNRDKELYFSEILRCTGLTQPTTLNHLKNLQDNKLVVVSKKIDHTFYKINAKNPQLYSIFSYFDYKRFNNLSLERKRAINEFISKLSIKPLIALVFGSTAKKTYTSKSDIDILLVYNIKEVKNKKLKEDIEAVSGVKIQTFIIDYEYFKDQLLRKEDHVIIGAIKTGFVVLGNDIFYREVLNEK